MVLTPAPNGQIPLPPGMEHVLADPTIQAATILLEAERAAVRAEKLQVRQSLARQRQAVSGAADSDALWNATDVRRRKQGLYNLYRQSVVLGAVVDLIAKRFISGAWSVVPRPKQAGGSGTVKGQTVKGDPRNQLLVLDFLMHCNENEDFKQILAKTLKDIVVFGETYLEVVSQAGVPWELYTCPAICMDYVRDGYGGVKWYIYKQPDDGKRPKRIDADVIMRIWEEDLTDPQKGFSLIEGMVDPLYSERMMTQAQHHTYENMGSYAPIQYTLPDGSTQMQAQALQVYLDESYSGTANAARERVIYGGAKGEALNLKGLDADFLKGLAATAVQIMGRAHVPPALISIIESGNIGGGTGEAQALSFQQNVMDYYKSLLLEKLTYQLIVKRFGVYDWVLDVSFASFETDPYTKQVWTIDELRGEQQKPPAPHGGDMTIIQLEAHARADTLGVELGLAGPPPITDPGTPKDTRSGPGAQQRQPDPPATGAAQRPQGGNQHGS